MSSKRKHPDAPEHGKCQSKHTVAHALCITVEQEHSRCPDRIKAVKPCWVFLDVCFYRKEILADDFGSLLIFIRLGIQPSTCRSGGAALKSSKMGRN